MVLEEPSFLSKTTTLYDLPEIPYVVIKLTKHTPSSFKDKCITLKQIQKEEQNS